MEYNEKHINAGKSFQGYLDDKIRRDIYTAVADILEGYPDVNVSQLKRCTKKAFDFFMSKYFVNPENLGASTAITAGRWDYQLKSGKALRRAIHSGNPYDVLSELEDAYFEIADNMGQWFSHDDLDSVIADIDCARDTLDNYADYDMDQLDAEDEVDGLLDQFYDLCDELRIWVPWDDSSIR